MNRKTKQIHICQNLKCGKQFPHRYDSRNKYCSHKCSGICKNDYQQFIYEQKKKDKKNNYYKDPKLCLECNEPITYKKGSNKRKFCDSSCSAKFNNKYKKLESILKQKITATCIYYGVDRKGAEKILLQKSTQAKKKNYFQSYNVGQKFIYTAHELLKIKNHCKSCNLIIADSKKYCNNYCQKNYEWLRLKKKIETESYKGIRPLRRYLLEKFGNICNCCNNTQWMGKPIALELEHKDGNSENNNLDNLAMLCPNCHAQTPTYKNKNKGKGRAWRRQRYKEGKSY